MTLEKGKVLEVVPELPDASALGAGVSTGVTAGFKETFGKETVGNGSFLMEAAGKAPTGGNIAAGAAGAPDTGFNWNEGTLVLSPLTAHTET